MAGGVVLYEHHIVGESHQFKDYNLIRIKDDKIVHFHTSHTDIENICACEAKIDGKSVVLVILYIDPNTTSKQACGFNSRNLLTYSPKIKGLFPELDDMNLSLPMVLCGDFNICLRNDPEFLQYMQETFALKLNSDPALSTTRNMTCIDGVLTCYVTDIETKNYVSYFPHHCPLLSVKN